MSDSDLNNLTTIRLTSNEMVNAPGIIYWARHSDNPVQLIGKMYPNLPLEAVQKLAKGDYKVIEAEEIIKVSVKPGTPVKLVATEAYGAPFEHEADALLFEDGTVCQMSAFSGMDPNDDADQLDMERIVLPDGARRFVVTQENGRLTVATDNNHSDEPHQEPKRKSFSPGR